MEKLLVDLYNEFTNTYMIKLSLINVCINRQKIKGLHQHFNTENNILYYGDDHKLTFNFSCYINDDILVQIGNLETRTALHTVNGKIIDNILKIFISDIPDYDICTFDFKNINETVTIDQEVSIINGKYVAVGSFIFEIIVEKI